MRTEAVLSSGGTNLCQAGLPDASRYRCDWAWLGRVPHGRGGDSSCGARPGTVPVTTT